MTDSNATVSVDHIRFQQVFRFGSILKAIGTSLQPTRIGIAMFMLALLIGGGRLWDAAVGAGEEAHPPFDATIVWVEGACERIASGTIALNSAEFLGGTQDLLWGTTARLWDGGHMWFLLLFGLWTAAVTALCGGVLCRLEAVHVATQDPAPLDPALDLAITRWSAFFGALLVPVVLAAVLAMGLILFGFILFNVPLLNILGGILYGLALLVGLGLTLLILGFGVCYPLLLPAVAVENCDGPDALHRAIAYIVARPLAWILYLITLALGLGLGLILVKTVGHWTIDATSGLVGLWTGGDTLSAASASLSGKETPELGWTDQWTSGLVAFWTSIVQWVIVGWAITYIMSASTRAYLLLRRSCDGMSESHIWWPGLTRGTLAPEPPADDSRNE